MVNPLRLREMIALASLEKGSHRRAAKITEHYRPDYVGPALIRTFFLTTLADLLVIALYLAGHAEEVLDALVYVDFLRLGGYLLIGYVATQALYLTVTFLLCRYRYREAGRIRDAYLLHLSDLRDLTEVPEGEGYDG